MPHYQKRGVLLYLWKCTTAGLKKKRNTFESWNRADWKENNSDYWVRRSSNLICVSLPPFTTSTKRSGASPSHLPFLSLSIFSSYVLALHTAVLSSRSPCMGLSGSRAVESWFIHQKKPKKKKELGEEAMISAHNPPHTPVSPNAVYTPYTTELYRVWLCI